MKYQPSCYLMSVLLGIFLFGPSTPFLAEETGTLSGIVVHGHGKPATDARVTLVELNRAQFVDTDGRFRFESVPFGEYHLHVDSKRFGSYMREFHFTAETGPIEVEVSASTHREKIVVSAGRGGHGSDEIVQPVNVLDAEELAENMQPTLGETLAQQPGVSSTYFGPGASRPVIRGQSGGRVRMLEGGLGVGDASATSPDHAVAIDPMTAERIEVLRGPATLLYGNTAVGGVVNVLDERVPDHRPQRPFGGTLKLRLGSVAHERAGALVLRGGAGSWAWHVDALRRESGDYDVPGGSLAGSRLENEVGTLGGAWIGKRGFFGAALRGTRLDYGVPAANDPVRIDMETLRLDLRGGFDLARGPIREMNFKAAVNDYEHREIEDGAIGTRFFNEAFEGRVEFAQREMGRLSGLFGVQFASSEARVVGAEAFLPKVRRSTYALFAVEGIDHGDLHYEIGLRLERQQLDPDVVVAADPVNCGAPRDADFASGSGSFGLTWLPGQSFGLSASVARTVRAPGAEELYSCGPHLATQSYEVGNVDLGRERTLGVDFGLRKRTGRLSGEVNLYYYDFGDYIYERDTGLIEDGLPLFRFVQGDASFRGGVMRAVVELVHDERHDFDLEFVADSVRAELDAGESLPRIPPASLGLGLRYRGDRWYGALLIRHYAEQERVATNESPSADYTLVRAKLGYRLVARGLLHDLLLTVSNLTDEEARPHTSRLKQLAPLPGRDVALSYRLVF